MMGFIDQFPMILMMLQLIYFLGLKETSAEESNGTAVVLKVNSNADLEDHQRYLDGGVLSMTCSAEPAGGSEDLAWFKDGVELPENSNSDDGPSHFSYQGKRYLMIRVLAVSDSGTYVCQDRNNPDLKVTRKVTVYDKIEFDSPANYTVIEGEGTTPISCSVKNNEGVTLYLRTSDNFNLPTSYFSEDNSSLNTFRLIKPDRNSKFNKIKCIAQKFLEMFNDYLIEQMDINIDVQYPPEFEQTEEIFYGIENQNASITCQVKAANPIPSSIIFKLENGDEILENNEKYEIETDLDAMKATLQIKSLGEEDFSVDKDQYECKATSGVSLQGVSKTFTIQKLLKPDAPIIVFKESTSDSFEFEIKDPKNTGGDGVKIIKYTVEWKQKNDNDSEKSVKDIKKLENVEVYKLDGMEPDKEYEFVFFAHNPAGRGEPITTFGKTTAQSNASDGLVPNSIIQSAIVCCSIVVWVMAVL